MYISTKYYRYQSKFDEVIAETTGCHFYPETGSYLLVSAAHDALWASVEH